MATRDPGPEDRGTNTALVVVVVILVAALIGVFIWWGTDRNDAEIEIDLSDNDLGLVESAPSLAASMLPAGIRVPAA